MLSKEFKDRTVLITGHTGFKGGWLALWLESLGADVIGFSLDPPTTPSFFDAAGISDRIIDYRGDIRNPVRVMEVIKDHNPEYIFHLAAQSLVRSSYENPLETFYINVMGTINILESIRLSQKPTVCVCVTSDKCYENREWAYAYRENDPMGGYDPYSASKGAAEIAIASYRRSFLNNKSQPGCEIASARAGNVIGGGDWADDRIVPDCIKSIVNGNVIKIRNPHAVRPWQFVLEPLFGYLLLATKMKNMPSNYSDSWNFGPYYSNTIDVRDLTKMIIQEWGVGTFEEGPATSPTGPHEANYLKLDIAKAVTLLGWKPIYGITDGVKKTIEWYKQYYSNKGAMYEFSLHQIEEYMCDMESSHN